jgi:secreted trypsin-like serine protease
MKFARVFISVAALLAAGAPAQAIIMRHDVEDARYRELGEQHRDVLVHMALRARDDGAPLLYNGMGTLVADAWVVTAAHVAAHMQANPPANGAPHYVFLRGRGYAVAEIIVHPGYNDQTIANDIALVRLARPVQGVRPACLYERDDEVGKIVHMAGAGYTGNGQQGPGEGSDGALRGATIMVGGQEGDVITWRFRAPGENGVTPLEGISGPGDSGGPALIETGSGFCIAGVSSAQRSTVEVDENGQEQANEGRYGVVEVYTRISRYVPWLRATMAQRAG